MSYIKFCLMSNSNLLSAFFRYNQVDFFLFQKSIFLKNLERKHNFKVGAALWRLQAVHRCRSAQMGSSYFVADDRKKCKTVGIWRIHKLAAKKTGKSATFLDEKRKRVKFTWIERSSRWWYWTAWKWLDFGKKRLKNFKSKIF